MLYLDPFLGADDDADATGKAGSPSNGSSSSGGSSSDATGMFWRFHVAQDSSVDRCAFLALAANLSPVVRPAGRMLSARVCAALAFRAARVCCFVLSHDDPTLPASPAALSIARPAAPHPWCLRASNAFRSPRIRRQVPRP